MVRGKLISGFDRMVNGIPDGLDWLHQSFGEVNAISREPNGHLYVDFRKAEVAETVRRAPDIAPTPSADVCLTVRYVVCKRGSTSRV